MKPFYHEHPLRDTPPGALSCEELRFWIRWLLKTPGTPWPKQALGRAMGCGGRGPGTTLNAKIYDKTRVWIYPSEQLRFTKQLPKILAGELEPCTVPGKRGHLRHAARVAAHPKPMRLPMRWRYDLKRGKLERHPFRTPQYRDTLPAFSTLMERCERWEGHWND